MSAITLTDSGILINHDFIPGGKSSAVSAGRITVTGAGIGPGLYQRTPASSSAIFFASAALRCNNMARSQVSFHRTQARRSDGSREALEGRGQVWLAYLRHGTQRIRGRSSGLYPLAVGEAAVKRTEPGPLVLMVILAQDWLDRIGGFLRVIVRDAAVAETCQPATGTERLGGRGVRGLSG
jgi:hypothetical protein